MRWIVGPEATAAKTRILVACLAIWVGLDVVTKIAALAFLDEEPIELGRAVGLTLLVNETLVAAPTLHDLEAASVSGAEVLVVVAAMAIGALVAIPFANASRPVWSRALLVVGAVMVPVMVASEVAPAIVHGADVPYRALMPARILASTALIVLLLRSTTSSTLAIALSTILGGNLGNALNAVYEPRGVVDFVYVPAIGPWVFNVADVAIVGGATLYAVGLPAAAIRRWREHADAA